VFLLQGADPAGVLDGGVHLEPVPDDAGIAQQPGAIPLTIPRHAIDVEAVVGFREPRALLEDREPREPGLVDLEHQSFEQRRVVPNGKTVLAVVIRAVEFETGSVAI
jgi:hypothetical protein